VHCFTLVAAEPQQLNNLSGRLAVLGRREDALAVIEQAVTINRQLAQARPDAFLPQFASSLNNFANLLSSFNRDAEELALCAEADAAVGASARVSIES